TSEIFLRSAWVKNLTMAPRVILAGIMVFQLFSPTVPNLRFMLLGREGVASITAKGEHDTGTIKGSVRIESKIPSRSFPLNFYSLKGTSVNKNQPSIPVNEIENVVIYLEDP